MTTDLILGTAGHIDHGKTALVKALTGVDTDRLPEEKKRGITIELGFAQLAIDEFRLGIVDVPGHERFVRNMLAGATGVDLALLVVAADDSVKPQTREHLEILKLLDLPAGVIALSKCDLPAADWIDLVEEEVRDLTADTFLAHAPLIRTSAHTGAGVEDLRRALADAARRVTQTRRAGGPFRMAIDRTFTIAGHGTVVTGSVSSGAAHVGDELVIEPGGAPVRVRGLQNHDQAVDAIQRGQRAAVNLAGVHHDEIGRGRELATPGHLVPSRRLTVELNVLATGSRPLKNRARARVHLGTAELMASVMLLEHDRLEPSQRAFAQLHLAEPAVSVWGQPFVLRSESPVQTIGGGHVLDPLAPKIRRGDAARVRAVAGLGSDDIIERASTALYFAGLRDWRPDELARSAGVDDVDQATQVLRQRGDLASLVVSPSRTISVHRDALDECCLSVEQSLEKLHRQFPLEATVDRSRLVHRMAYLGGDAVVDAILAHMHQAGRIRLSGRRAALAGHGPQLSNGEQKLLEQIIETYQKAGCQPPSVADVKKQAAKNQAAVPQLTALAAEQGDLVKIADDLYLHADVERDMRDALAAELTNGQGWTVSQIRDRLGTTRKYAIPLCEYLDRIGFTRRQGDVRMLAGGVSADARVES